MAFCRRVCGIKEFIHSLASVNEVSHESLVLVTRYMVVKNRRKMFPCFGLVGCAGLRVMACLKTGIYVVSLHVCLLFDLWSNHPFTSNNNMFNITLW